MTPQIYHLSYIVKRGGCIFLINPDPRNRFIFLAASSVRRSIRFEGMELFLTARGTYRNHNVSFGDIVEDIKNNIVLIQLIRQSKEYEENFQEWLPIAQRKEMQKYGIYKHTHGIAQHDIFIVLSLNYRCVYLIGLIGTVVRQLYQNSTKNSAHIMHKKTPLLHIRQKHVV